MFKSRLKLAGIVLLSLGGSACKSPTADWFTTAVETSHYQLKLLAEKTEAASVDSVGFPRTVDGNMIHFVNLTDWTSGFFPGSLWYAYELTGDLTLKDEARKFTDRMEGVQNLTNTHDLGFMAFCSYGNAYRLSPQATDCDIIIKAADNLAERFQPQVGLIRSWDFGEWSYPVIIDNMMNLELLFWASKITGDDKYKKIAISHADKTMQNHYRKDMSSYHVVSYKQEDGTVESKGTWQGYSDESAWARGQAWGLYGYTLCYKETGERKYWERAEAIANYIFSHPNLPEDLIPYWDYDAPNIPNEPRDVSAAAVTCSALLQLSGLLSDGQRYFILAEKMLQTLSTPEYLAEKGGNNGFILKHSTGNLPFQTEIDVPLNYADYYYLEALKRYKEIKDKQ